MNFPMEFSTVNYAYRRKRNVNADEENTRQMSGKCLLFIDPFERMQAEKFHIFVVLDKKIVFTSKKPLMELFFSMHTF